MAIALTATAAGVVAFGLLGRDPRPSPPGGVPAGTDGASYYVDCEAGSDAAAGTAVRSAWRSLDRVNAERFSPGDTIHLKRDCAWDGGLTTRSDGARGRPITFTAYGQGARPVIRNRSGGPHASGVTVAGRHTVVENLAVEDVRGAGVLMRRGADHGVVAGTEVTRTGLGVESRARGTTIVGNDVHDLHMVVDTPRPDDDFGAVCFWLAGPEIEVAHNRGTNCRARSTDYGFDGGFVEIWRNGDRANIHDNYAEATNGFLEAGGSGSARGVTVAQNLMVNVGAAVCLHDTGPFAIAWDDLRFEHNTYYETSGRQHFLSCTRDVSGKLVMRNNIFSGAGPIAESGQFNHTHNLYHLPEGGGIGYGLGQGERTADPLFADPGKDDFRLRAGSVAIDSGEPLHYERDFWNRPRPAGEGPDLGAFEHQPGPPNASDDRPGE